MTKFVEAFVNDAPTVSDQAGCKLFFDSGYALEFVWTPNIVLVAKDNKVTSRQTCRF